MSGRGEAPRTEPGRELLDALTVGSVADLVGDPALAEVRRSIARDILAIEAAAAREALESRLVLLAALGHIRSLSLVPHGSPEAFYRSQVSDAIATAQRAIDMDRAARASDGGR